MRRSAPLKRSAPPRRKTPLERNRCTPPKVSRPKQSKITRSAQGEQCLARIPGVCNRDPATVVLAHLNGGGAGMKAPNFQAAYACHACHAWLDGGYTQDEATRAERDLYHLEAVIRTQERLVEKGLIIIAE